VWVVLNTTRSLRIKNFCDPQVLRNKTVSMVVWILQWLFIIGLSYLFLFPIIFLITTSLQDPASVNDPSIIWIPKKLSLVSLKETIIILDYWRSAGLTIFVSVISTLCTLLSCSLVGYGFARFKFPGKNLLFMLVVLTIILPPQTILPSMTLNFNYFDFGGILSLIPGKPTINLLDTPFTFVLPSLFASGLRGGLFIFIFRQFFWGIPKALEEAARIDGCSAFNTFIRIIVPIAVPVFITVTLFSFVWHWNDLYSATMYFTDVRLLTPNLNNLDRLLATSTVDVKGYAARTYMAAAPLLVILPPLILYIFTQRYFTESIERTGIVG
jgi:multiple sugar transport system permease protein